MYGHDNNVSAPVPVMVVTGGPLALMTARTECHTVSRLLRVPSCFLSKYDEAWNRPAVK
jgi:hypothetical protein